MNSTNMNKDFSRLVEKIKEEHQRLIEDLRAFDPAVRRKAVIQLGSEKIKETAPFLVPLLQDKNKGVREAVLEALINIGGEEIIQDLLPFLRIRDASVRNAAVEILNTIAQNSIHPLLPLLKDKNKDIRLFAADILGSSTSSQAVKSLVEVLKDKEPNVRNSAVIGLGKLKARQATPALLDLLQQEQEEWVVFSIVESLVQIGGSIAPSLVGLLDNDNELIVSAATEALAKIGDSKTLLPLLKKALSTMGKLHETIAGALIEILKRQDLEFLKPEVVEELKSFFLGFASSEADSWIRYHTIEILGELKVREATGLLLHNLKGKDPFLKIASIKALGLIGDKETLSALEALMHDQDSNVRRTAEESLEKLK